MTLPRSWRLYCLIREVATGRRIYDWSELGI